jgi:pimeloyl-ACP methyl ester carboxylesterase
VREHQLSEPALSDGFEPITGPASEAPVPNRVRAPRLARHTIALADGHVVGLAVSGRGVPIVVIHGFTAEGFLYAQTLNRLVMRGFKVIAVDMASHGSTQGLPLGGASLHDYGELLGRAIGELGIRKAIFAGHSMGGRCITEFAVQQPERVIALLLLDAIVGDTWDRMTMLFRVAPWVMPAFGVALVGDSLSTVPMLSDREQATKFLRLVTPTLVGHAVQPWRLIGPALSIVRSPASRPLLDQLDENLVPTFVIHGDRDAIVPMCTARDAARRSGGQLVTVHGASHSWLLKDPETLPAIVEDLLGDQLGYAIRNAIGAAGAESVDELEEICYEPGAKVLDLTPEVRWTPVDEAHRRPRYTWTISEGRGVAGRDGSGPAAPV